MADGLSLKAELCLLERLAQLGDRGARLGPAAAPRVQYLAHCPAIFLFSFNYYAEEVLLVLPHAGNYRSDDFAIIVWWNLQGVPSTLRLWMG